MNINKNDFIAFLKNNDVATVLGREEYYNDFIAKSMKLIIEVYEEDRQGNKESFEEVLKLIKSYRRIVNILNFENQLSNINPNTYEEILGEISYWESYEGIGKKYYRINKEKLEKLKLDLNNEINPPEEVIKRRLRVKELEKAQERQKANSVYDDLKISITSKDIEKYLSEMNFLSDDKVSSNKIKYPALVFFYKEGDLIEIRRESVDLGKKLDGNIDFDEIKVMEIPKKKINELFYEALIKFRPKNPLKSLALYQAPNYKTFNEVKRKYFGKLTPKKIMKIIETHDVPIYYFDNGLVLIHRDELAKAISENKYL